MVQISEHPLAYHCLGRHPSLFVRGFDVPPVAVRIGNILFGFRNELSLGGRDTCSYIHVFVSGFFMGRSNAPFQFEGLCGVARLDGDQTFRHKVHFFELPGKHPIRLSGITRIRK